MVMRGVLFVGTELTRIQTKNHKEEGAEMNIIDNNFWSGSKFPSFSFQKIFCLSIVNPGVKSIDQVRL